MIDIENFERDQNENMDKQQSSPRKRKQLGPAPIASFEDTSSDELKLKVRTRKHSPFTYKWYCSSSTIFFLFPYLLGFRIEVDLLFIDKIEFQFSFSILQSNGMFAVQIEIESMVGDAWLLRKENRSRKR